MNLKKLLEERAAKAAALRAIVEAAEKESRDLNSEESAKFDEVEEEIRALDERIERARKVEDIAARSVDIETKDEGTSGAAGREDRSGYRAPAEPFDYQAEDEQRGLALGGWMQGCARVPVGKRQMRACEHMHLDPRADRVKLLLRGCVDVSDYEARIQQTAVGSDGGFLVPEGFMARFDKAMLAFGGIRQVAEVIRTRTGEDLPWPGADDTGNVGALLAETAAAGVTDVAFSRQVWHAHPYTSTGVRVSRHLLRDSAIDMVGLVAELLGERLGRITAQHFATGTGTGQPEGIESGSVLGVTAASATALAADELEDLIESVDPAYRSLPGVGFLCHSAIRSQIGKLKDGNGQYLFRSAGSGAPASAFGEVINIDQELDSTIAAAAQSIFFGLLSAYKIRDVGEMELVRLDERFGEFNQVAWYIFSRHDGKVLNSGGDPIKHVLH